MTIASDTRHPASFRSLWLGMAAYLVPTFPIAFVWHLVLFEPNYHALQIYRADPIIPFGLASMIIQAIIFSWIFPRAFCGQQRVGPEKWTALRAGCRLVVVVIHNAGGCSQTSHGLDFRLCSARNRLHGLAVPDRGAPDRAGVSKMMARVGVTIFSG